MSALSRLGFWLRRFTGHRPPRTSPKIRTRPVSARLQLEPLEDRWLLSTALHLDFGTGSEAAAPGYTAVPLAIYTPAAGYGWASLSGLKAMDRGTADPLTRSFHQGAAGTFLMDLPNGVYDVTATLGDATLRHDSMAISLEGQTVASGLSTGPGRFLQQTFRIQLTDGQLNFGISCTGGKGGTFALDALDIQGNLHLDFGTGSEAAAPGYTAVPLMAYAPAAGYGWASLSGLKAMDRGTVDPLTRSFHQGAAGTFLMDLPNGVYDITPTIGDSLLRHDFMALSIEGQSVASGLSTGPGRFLQPTYRVQIADGQLHFGISCTGGKGGTFALDALDIQPVTALSSPLLIDAGANLTIGEGTPVSFSGQASGGTAPLSYSWNLGDSNTAGGSLTPQHAYSDNGSYTATLTVTDVTGATLQDTVTITVTNVTPSVTLTGLPASGHSPEGTALTLGATIADPSTTDMTAGFTRAWSVTKNGAAFASGTASSVSFTPNDNGSYVATLTATDKDGGTGTASATITVDNVAPTAVFANNGAVNEGGTGIVAFSVPADVSSADTSAGFTYSFDFDNSGTFEVTGSTTATATVLASFLADGPGSRTVKGRIQDKDGGYTDYTTTITINNVPPTVGLPVSYSASPGSAIAFSATVSDPSPVDAAGPFTYSWDFGDSATSTSAIPTHAYASSGTYPVSVTVQDKDGGATTRTTSAVITDAGVNTSPYIVTPYDKIPNFGASPTITSVQSGPWSDTATWSTGVLPAAGDVMSINPNTIVTFDASSTPALDTVVIQNAGKLQFRTDISTQLSVVNLLVLGGGELAIGTQANPVDAGVKAEIVFPDQPLDTTTDPSQYGHGLIGLGKVTMAGAPKAATFVRLADEAKAGDSTLTLSQPVPDWLPGDRLVLPDTRQLVDSERFGSYTPQWELPVIQSVSGDGLVVTLTSKLQFDHLGVRNPSGNLDYLPHVGDLTRNVVVRSQSATGTRGYVLFTQRADVDIRYTQFAGLGRTTNSGFDDTTYDSSGNVTHLGTNQSSRYPVYFRHLMGPTTTPANGYQYTFSGNTVMCPLNPMPFRWGLTLNDSHYGLVSDNVVYNWAGAGIVGESGNESYNVIQHNFVVAVRGDQSPRINTGQDGAAYWFNNFNNYIHDNVAADAIGTFVGIVAGSGFNLYVPAASSTNKPVPLFPGADLMVAGQYKVMNMQLTPILEFARNEAYGACATGLTLWQLGTDGYSAKATATSYVTDFVAWNCWEEGFFGYPVQNLTFDGFIVRGSSRAMNAIDQGHGWASGDYWAGNVTLQRADIQGMWEGVGYASNTPGTFTIKDSYFRNYNADIVVTTLSTAGARTSKPARATIIDNVRFDPYSATSPFTAIKMFYTPGYVGADYIQKDEVYVYSYNGVSSDNFQVYYLEQAPTFIVPQTTYYGPDDDGDGIGDWVDSQGSPEAGLTNAENWAKYGIATAGSVTPTSTTRANIFGYVRAF